MKDKFIYLLLIAILLTGVLPASAAPALGNNDPTQTTLCDQVALDQAEADFRSLLSENGQVPVDDPAVETAAQLVINLSKKCYDTMQAERNSLNLQGGDPIFIDEGPIDRYSGGRAEAFIASDAKWGAPTLGTPGGTVTYSFMGSGLNLSTEGDPSFGNSVAFTSLKGFSPCFLTEVQTAFAAWAAVSDINFVQVADSNTAFDAVGATGDIRIGAHAFDGVYGTLAHAYLPYNYYTGDGDIHFDKDESWSCTTSGGFDIGLVALHEIGHAIGLYHENTSSIAIMDPSYNPSLSLSGLQSDDIAGARAIYGGAPESIFAPAGNDEISTATLITGLTYQNQVNTSGTTPDSNPYTSSDPNPITCTDHLGTPNSLGGGWSTVWYKYKTPATVDESIQADTQGTTSYDTYIAVYEGDASGNLPSYAGFVGCNDDSPDGPFSRISFVGTKDTWYYFEVAQFRCFEVDTNGCATVPNPNGGDLTFNVNITNVDVSIGTSKNTSYYLYPDTVLNDVYPSILDGPVKVSSTIGENIFTSQRVTSGDSYNELMGYPANKLTTEYWFPYYDHGYPNVVGSNMRTWVLVGNASDTDTAIVDIYIGGVKKTSAANISPGGRITPRWIGLQGGPVRVVSTNAVPIFASQRVFTSNNNAFNENLGYPADQFTTEYWFPWYDDVNLTNYILVGNTSTTTQATVDIYFGATKKGTYNVPANGTISQQYVDEIGGPVRVVATNGIDIVTSQKSISGVNNSYNEVIGYPFDQFTTEYWFPWYDHGYPKVGGSNMRTWILVGNPSSTLTATVNIYIDGNLMAGSPFSIGPNGKATPRWIGTQGGPVHVVSDIPVFASERVFTVPNDVFNEAMGIPGNKLTTEYWYPWFDSVNMTNEILISK